MKPRRPAAIPFEQIRSKIQASLEASGLPYPFDDRDLAPASPDLVRRLPDWVGRCGILKDREALVLWCEARAGKGNAFTSQVILDLPPGRYLVDTLDVAAGQWVSRESTAGGPLMAGLPRAAGPVLIRIRAFGV